MNVTPVTGQRVEATRTAMDYQQHRLGTSLLQVEAEHSVHYGGVIVVAPAGNE